MYANYILPNLAHSVTCLYCYAVLSQNDIFFLLKRVIFLFIKLIYDHCKKCEICRKALKKTHL